MVVVRALATIPALDRGYSVGKAECSRRVEFVNLRIDLGGKCKLLVYVPQYHGQPTNKITRKT
jgi:hypothetical protein